MANTGDTFPGTGESVDRAGLTAWTGPENVVSDNTTDATCNGTGSDYLVARNYGFTVPAGATINGILVRVEASEHSGGTEPLLAQLQDATAALIGSSKSTSNEGSISGTTKAVYTYGSTSDLWGATLDDTIVNDPDFGVRLWFTTAHDVRVDFVTLAIEYTPAAVYEDRAASFTGVGTFAASGVRIRTRTATLAGAGAVTSAWNRLRLRTAAMIGTGTLVATPEQQGPVYKDAAASFTGTGTASAAWARLRNRVADWVGGSTLEAARVRVRLQTVTYTGAGLLVADPEAPGGGPGGGNGDPCCRPIRVHRIPTSYTGPALARMLRIRRW